MLLCAVLAFTLMFAEHRLSFMEDVRAQLTTVVAPVQWAVSLPSEGLAWAALVFSDQRALVEENQRLRQQLLTLSHRVQRMANLTAENVRLRERSMPRLAKTFPISPPSSCHWIPTPSPSRW